MSFVSVVSGFVETYYFEQDLPDPVCPVVSLDERGTMRFSEARE